MGTPLRSAAEGDGVKLTAIQQITVRNLEHSRDTAVPVTLATCADAGALVGEKERSGFTYTVLLAKLLALELRHHRDVNTTLVDRALRRHPNVNLGVAVSTGDGSLVVPVVQGADEIPLADLSARIAELRQRAEAQKLVSEDVRGATFTLSSIGMFVSDTIGVATIPPGQAGILLVSGISEGVVAADGRPRVRPLLPLSLTVDHRSVNGAAMAAFLKGLVARIEVCALSAEAAI